MKISILCHVVYCTVFSKPIAKQNSYRSTTSHTHCKSNRFLHQFLEDLDIDQKFHTPIQKTIAFGISATSSEPVGQIQRYCIGQLLTLSNPFFVDGSRYQYEIPQPIEGKYTHSMGVLRTVR